MTVGPADRWTLPLYNGCWSFFAGRASFRDAPLPASEAELPKGAVLVFLPGWDEISRLKEALESSASFSGGRYVLQCTLIAFQSSHQQVIVHCSQRKLVCFHGQLTACVINMFGHDSSDHAKVRWCSCDDTVTCATL